MRRGDKWRAPKNVGFAAISGNEGQPGPFYKTKTLAKMSQI
jgi:hypothetical protein